MKAIIATTYGPPEVARLAEVPQPVPKPQEVLVRVHATTVNRTDAGFRSAAYFISRFWTGLWRPRQPIFGSEFAGEVVALGPQATQFAVGDRVFGFSEFGAHAEYLTMPQGGALTTMPQGWGFEEAAPLTEGAHYALNGLRGAKVQAGHEVLVYGATGAIGSAAVQLLRHMGAHVTAVCATPHLDLVRGLGAHEVIDYTREDFTAIPRRFDLVLDAVGKRSFGECKPLLKPQGSYISSELGRYAQNVFFALIGPLTSGKRVRFPIPSLHQEDVVFLRQLAEDGQFRPVIDRHYDFADIVDAYRYVETGQKIGNVVLRVGA